MRGCAATKVGVCSLLVCPACLLRSSSLTHTYVVYYLGYSYDAIQDNEEAKLIVASGGTPEPVGRSRVFDPTMNAIGFDDCDYVSHETTPSWCKLFASVYLSMLLFIDL